MGTSPPADYVRVFSCLWYSSQKLEVASVMCRVALVTLSVCPSQESCQALPDLDQCLQIFVILLRSKAF